MGAFTCWSVVARIILGTDQAIPFDGKSLKDMTYPQKSNRNLLGS
jgi:hypothetical protein